MGQEYPAGRHAGRGRGGCIDRDAGEDAARDAKGPGSFHVNLYDALAGLDPATLAGRAKLS